jgi:pyruvoyl-dependent arginine decarboxylase (PvlArgDC)
MTQPNLRDWVMAETRDELNAFGRALADAGIRLPPEATRALGSLLIAAINAGVRAAAAETARSVEAALQEEGIERHFIVKFDELE